jgi:DNA polymerase-3 subunit delta'
MQFKSIIGQEPVKKKLLSSVRENRVAHTQLLLGPEGCGSMALAIAFVQYINCKNKTAEDSCGVCPSCIKYQKFSHPDLHLYFPSTTNQTIKKDPKSKLFLTEFREYLEHCGAYPTQKGWYQKLGVGNKQGTIYTRDASDITHEMALKSYEAEYKAFIIWMPEKLNESASNKLLKTFEEPPNKTLIILVGERYELLLPTVRSRAQLVKLPKLKDYAVAEALYTKTEATEEEAHNISLVVNGNWNLALEAYENAEETQSNFILFRQWLRLCYRPGNFIELNKLNSELAGLGRERQKNFLNYGLETIHSSLQHNQGNSQIVKKSGEELEFSEKFAPIINQANQTEIYQLLNESIYHIERNAHAGILFSDLSFKIGDLLKRKPALTS